MKIKQICVYPIKSLRGITLPSHNATSAGFDYDRRFMLRRVSDGKNMNVSTFTAMCLFTTELSSEHVPRKVLVRYAKDHVFDHPAQKLAPGDEVLEIELEPDFQSLSPISVDLYGSTTSGYAMGERYNKWFSERFGFEVMLLYLGENRRKVLGNISPNVEPAFVGDADPKKKYESTGTSTGWLDGLKAGVGSVANTVAGYARVSSYKGVDEGISFADVAPYLIVSEKSWQNVQSRLPDGEGMDIMKFRPNIIIEGADEEFEEDYWAELSIGGEQGTRLFLTQNCARCNSLNVDYDTGKVGTGASGGILKLLQKDRRVDPGSKYSPIFGRYGFLGIKKRTKEENGVLLKVGDEVGIVRKNERRTHWYWPELCT